MMELMELMEMTCWRVVSLEEKGTGGKERKKTTGTASAAPGRQNHTGGLSEWRMWHDCCTTERGEWIETFSSNPTQIQSKMMVT